MKSNCRNKILAKEEKMTRLKTKKEIILRRKARMRKQKNKRRKINEEEKKKKETNRVFGCGDFLNESMRNPLRIDLTIQT